MAKVSHSSTHRYVSGASQLVEALKQLGAEIRSFVAERGVREAIKPILVSAKRYAKRSERTGALRESLVAKTVHYKKTGTAVGLVGPDRRYYRKGRKTSLVVAAIAGADRPANYAHLVEYGHHAVAPISGTTRRRKTAIPTKNGTTWVPAKPFIRPAVLTTRAAQSAGFEKGIADGFAQALKNANRAVAALK